ncbi:TrbC/VirB2 family protein [Luteibacter aegosomaticola]|uniref:TrbC/VirB2 family protein n=1 Tax=Luteibacter aegosomaticola TaxID=2911538 RepID=UPI001FFB69B5|nr:TrbC/VirB2 family protein [Luteibacter aegosomaticola]UPG91592.1 TrbC/VirB2 family protein [Luteibacter aegosomaticola]
MSLPSLSKAIATTKNPLLTTALAFLFVALAFVPEIALAQVSDTQDKVCGFFGGINTILNAASIVVVTVAVIFSGYQIAFAHKRISDVTPPLLGGVLIGAAAQIAKMVVQGKDGSGTSAAGGSCSSTGFLMDAANAAMHLLHFHA